MDDWHEMPEGEFTPTEPGTYGRTMPDGTRMPLVKVREVPGAVTSTEVTDRRELPKDAPIGHPEKWMAMNRAARRAAKRGWRN